MQPGYEEGDALYSVHWLSKFKWLPVAIAAIPIDKAPGRHFRSTAIQPHTTAFQVKAQQALLAAIFEEAALSLRHILYCCLVKAHFNENIELNFGGKTLY
jgi:hypothetical protein